MAGGRFSAWLYSQEPQPVRPAERKHTLNQQSEALPERPLAKPPAIFASQVPKVSRRFTVFTSTVPQLIAVDASVATKIVINACYYANRVQFIKHGRPLRAVLQPRSANRIGLRASVSSQSRCRSGSEKRWQNQRAVRWKFHGSRRCRLFGIVNIEFRILSTLSPMSPSVSSRNVLKAAMCCHSGAIANPLIAIKYAGASTVRQRYISKGRSKTGQQLVVKAMFSVV